MFSITFAPRAAAHVSASQWPALNCAGYATGTPAAANVAALLAGRPAQFVTEFTAATADMVGVSSLAASHDSSAIHDSQLITSTAEYVFTLSLLAHTQQHLVLGLLDATPLDAGDFDSLTFSVTKNGSSILSRQFSSPSDVTQYFSNNAIDLGLVSLNASSGRQDIRFELDLASSTPADGFIANVIFANAASVPEPSPAVLFLFIASLAVFRRREAD